MNGEPLPADHGYPGAPHRARACSATCAPTKWLTEIELTTLEAFDAYWVPLGWAKEAPILTQSRIDVPRDGAPVAAGPVADRRRRLGARPRHLGASRSRSTRSAGSRPSCRAPISDATWVQWRRWDASAGEHPCAVRATDGEGEIQTDRAHAAGA